MGKNEIQIDDVTYQLNRVFTGSRTVSEIMADAIVEQMREESAVDAPKRTAV